MALYIFKFLHLICGTTIFGILIAAFFYIARSIHQRNSSLINYALRASYFGDGIILLCALIQFATASKLVSAGHFTLAVPWIFVAYHAFGFVILLWIINFFIKRFFLSKNEIGTCAVKSFYLVNITMIFIFIIIIHDAVTHSTWLDFLFRK